MRQLLNQRWDKNLKDDYINQFDNTDTNNITEEMIKILNDKNYNDECINSLTEKLSSIHN